MTFTKIEIERELNSTSPTIIWKLISTADGMARWLADSITQDGDKLTFMWGNPWDHNEKRVAKFTMKKKNEAVRFEWDDPDTEGTYVEIRMERSSITDDFILSVTDFATEEDTERLRSIWDHNFQRLRQSSGI